MPSVEQIIQVLKLSSRYLTAISIICGTLLFISEQLSKTLGVFQLTQDYRQWIGIAFISSMTMVVIDCFMKIGTVVKGFVVNKKSNKKLIQSLRALTEEEKQILRYYYAKESKTNTLRIDDGIVNGLRNKGIIYLSATQGTASEGFSHNISELAWDYINKNPKLLEGTTNSFRTDKSPYNLI